jgi:4'-phosphopantetheinyl transferase
VVARHTGQRPADVQLDRTCGRCGELHGKPAVQGSGLEVSVTHSGALVAVGVAAGSTLGVDVEQLDRERLPATEAFVRSVLSAGEQARLAVAADPVRTLLVAWTRKEAVTKATGDGLRIPFRQVVVSGADEPPLLLSWPYPSSPGTVTLFDLDAGSGYVASLAVIGSCAAVRARDGSGLLRGTASPLATGLEFE